MKFAVQAALACSLVFANPAFAAAPVPAAQATAVNPAHTKAVQDLLGAMQMLKIVFEVRNLDTGVSRRTHLWARSWAGKLASNKRSPWLERSHTP
jgi:hypothetical protein